MSASNHNSPRKPSGSSTSPVSLTPSGSPSHSAGIFRANMGTAAGLKTLNSGWQVWGNPAPSSRNPSVSSAASAAEASPSQQTYRLDESWATGRSPNGTWDEMNGSPQRKDIPQMDPHTVSLHRQRPAVSGATSLSGAPALAKAGQYSPQRFEGAAIKDPSSTQQLYPGASSSFGHQQSLMQGSVTASGFDQVQPSSAVEGDLSVALRGMAVEDEYGLGQQAFRQSPGGSQTSVYPIHQPHPPVPLNRTLSATQHPRAPFNGFPQPDFSGYYSAPSRMEFAFPYDAYRTNPADPSLYAASPALAAATPAGPYATMAPTLHPHMVSEVHHGQQSSLFYDYAVSGRQGSQYYYPTQPLMYHSHHAIPGGLAPNAHADKKQFTIQQTQALTSQNMIYANMRSTPSPHPQAFQAVEYPPHMPLMLPGALYGHAPMGVSTLHVFPRGRRPGYDVNNGNRSPLLDEFRSNKNRGWELRDIFGHIVEFSGDQHGSRFIQQKLEGSSSEERQSVFDEIVPQYALQLVKDVFGNYVIQKLFEHGSNTQRSQLAATMEGHILSLALHMYGCRVVQKAVEFISSEQQGLFVKELDENVLECVKDANGNHVIQRLIELVPPEKLGFIASFCGNVFNLASHPYGCRVLQRCLEYLPEEQQRPLLDELHQHSSKLMLDQFGNYVVQFVLEKGQPQDKALITNELRTDLVKMSCHKFASNVCEKALITADQGTRQALVNEILLPRKDAVDMVVMMMKDQFGNYVLQRALTVAEGDQRDALVGRIRPQLLALRRQSSAYGKHLIAIERLLEKCTSSDVAEQHAHPVDTSSKSQ